MDRSASCPLPTYLLVKTPTRKVCHSADPARTDYRTSSWVRSYYRKSNHHELLAGYPSHPLQIANIAEDEKAHVLGI